jgi:Xaa-Pro dipeptidase
MNDLSRHAPLADLYAEHLRVMEARAAAALDGSGLARLLIPSGRLQYPFQDDNPLPFRVNPWFKAWVPLTRLTDSWLVVEPGRRPQVVYCQPADYWHLPPLPPHGYWTEHVDVVVVRTPEEAARHLPPAADSAILGEPGWGLGEHVPNNPRRVLDRLVWTRAVKTAYELEAMRIASRRAVRGHLAAERAFREGRSERAIHEAYLHATGHSDLDLPYGNIVALNEHAAVLHYQHQRHDLPDAHRSFLIDAGAEAIGYAADITRTFGNGDATFQALLDGVERVQQQLCARVCPGTDYRDIHLDAHRQLAGVLQELGVVRMTPEAMVDSGVTSVFFPHGIGHLLGLQVHDAGGFAAGPEGGSIEKPAGHPFLRLTRTLQEDVVVTIEPGLYFIPMLLEELRARPEAARVDWALVDHLSRFGGVRIEDDVRAVADGAPENLTRDAFAQAERGG